MHIEDLYIQWNHISIRLEYKYDGLFPKGWKGLAGQTGPGAVAVACSDLLGD